MANSDDINNPLSVIDAVNNSVVSDSNTPQVLFAMQLTRSGRPWVLGKTVDPSVVSQKFVYIFNARALAKSNPPVSPFFQRGRCLREGVNPSLPKRGRGDLRAQCNWNHLENIVESYVKNC